MSAFILFAVFLLVFSLLKFLNISSPPRTPRLVCSDHKFKEIVLKYCPSLLENYCPVRLWGRSGHIQTIVHATVGRTYCPSVPGKRCAARAEDGASVTWDVYEPTAASQFPSVYTIAICPGIANSSESLYVRSMVALACADGYRCIVLNHIGVLPHVKITSPRVFRYGSTSEFRLMLSRHMESYPTTKLLLVGFSMGGNIVTKYLGETKPRPENILGAVAICQGFSAQKMLSALLGWQNLARLYLFSMTENMRGVILRNREVLLTDDVKRRFNLDERKITTAATLPELDEYYTRRVHGFKSVEDLYAVDSCVNYLHNINVPIVFINSKDDPIVHPDVLDIPEAYAETHPNSMYIETEHGGHLGFYDGGTFAPSSAATWIDRTAVNVVNGLANLDSF